MPIKELLQTKKPIIMGILNLTPDSFSDGGKYNSLAKAIRRIKQLEEEGANLIDLGGESTGPNSKNVTEKEEAKRVIPLLRAIRTITKLPISIDTYKAEIARQALEEGADLINDVTALRADPKLGKIIAYYKCPIILMYSKDNSPRTSIKKTKYKNLIKTINTFLAKRIKYAEEKGIRDIIVDPGMGQFISALPEYSYEIIAKLSQLKVLKKPIMIGISRKSFLGKEMQERDAKSAALSAIAYLNGASIIRTHNIKATKECLTWN